MNLRWLFVLAVLVIAPALFPHIAYGQTNNPSSVEFESPDHNVAEVNGYELDILVCSNPPTCTNQSFIQTIQIAKSNVTQIGTNPATNAPIYSASLNLQPIKFGSYVGVMRTVAGAVKSVNSDASSVFVRVPGPPSKPAFK